MNDAELYIAIIRPLLAWYDQNKRDLPWRHTRDPYSIWLSEIMCQQTRVDTVIAYYERFLCALPTIEELANCDEQKLLKLWEGLGYYSRVRNMQVAAKDVLQRGSFPRTAREIMTLQGIGEYTAGAIASIAFEAPEPAVDGNVLRVISRVTGSRDNIDLPATKHNIASKLRAVYPLGRCGDFTQSLMELGALVCIPNGEPKCESCPLLEHCYARRENKLIEIPVRAEKRLRKVEDRTVLLFMCEGKVALVKRKKTGLLASMWEYPNVEGTYTTDRVLEYCCRLNVNGKIEKKGRAKHIFSHIEWHMTVYLVSVDQQIGELTWVSREELMRDYPIPTAFKGCTAMISSTQF